MGENKKRMHKSFIRSFYPVLSFSQNRKEEKKDVVLLLFALFVLAAASFVYLYDDMIDMVMNSNLLLRSVFEGKLLEYYTYTLEHSTSAFAANYDLPLYLIFALWNLPFALLFHFEANCFVYLWFKLLIVLCIVGCSCIMYRIYRLFDEEEHFTRGSFLVLMATSPLVFLGEFVAGQYDCISMVFILAGLYEYLKGRDKHSLLFFCLAVPLKIYAVFLFIPLLVYKEKNILMILLKTACVFVIPLFCRLLFRGDLAYSFLLGAQTRDAAQLLVGASVRISSIEIHVFLLLFLLLCFICYFCKYDKAKVLMISAAVYTSFIVFIPIRSYWVFLAEPFLLLLITTRPEFYKVNFLVHTAAVISGSIFFLYFHGIYNTTWMTRRLGLIKITELPSVVKYGSFKNFINVHGWAVYMPILRTVFTGSCVMLLVINLFDPEKMKFSSGISPRVLSWIKSGVIAGILVIMVFVEIFPCSLPVIDTLNYAESDIRPYINYDPLLPGKKEKTERAEKTGDQIQVLKIPGKEGIPINTEESAKYYSADINSGAVIEQPFTVAGERSVSEISFQCFNTYPSRWSRVRINISIVDAAAQKVLAETIIGGALVKTGEIYIAGIKDTHLPEGRYLIRITNTELPHYIPYAGSPVYMMCSPDARSAEPVLIDGRRMEYPVCICVN